MGAIGRDDRAGPVGPVHEVITDEIAPVHVRVEPRTRVVLVEEVPLPFMVQDAVGIVQPTGRRRHVVPGAMRVSGQDPTTMQSAIHVICRQWPVTVSGRWREEVRGVHHATSFRKTDRRLSWTGIIDTPRLNGTHLDWMMGGGAPPIILTRVTTRASSRCTHLHW